MIIVLIQIVKGKAPEAHVETYFNMSKLHNPMPEKSSKVIEKGKAGRTS
jgi:hypothetical protein